MLGQSEIPQGVNLSEITDETCEMLGIPLNKVRELRERQARSVYEKQGRNYYNSLARQQNHSTDPLEISVGDNSLQVPIPPHTKPSEISEAIMNKFREKPKTERQYGKVTLEEAVSSWISGYMEGAFDNRDWPTVVSAAHSTEQDAIILPRLRSIVVQDLGEGFKIAQAIEKSRKDKVNQQGKPANPTNI